MTDNNDFPLFYHDKQGITDREDIAKDMRLIPKDKRYEVSREYERLYKKGAGRDAANTYLNELANGYRNG